LSTLGRQGEVAQSVEHTAENRGVAGSIPALAIVAAGAGFAGVLTSVGR
jgi:H+/gluconate symporter-like permease